MLIYKHLLMDNVLRRTLTLKVGNSQSYFFTEDGVRFLLLHQRNVQIYVENTEKIMNDLVLHLPNWIEQASRSSHKGSHL